MVVLPRTYGTAQDRWQPFKNLHFNNRMNMEQGLQSIISSGKLDAIFNEHYGKITEQLKLDKRRIFVLGNPLLPDEFSYLVPNLENL